MKAKSDPVGTVPKSKSGKGPSSAGAKAKRKGQPGAEAKPGNSSGAAGLRIKGRIVSRGIAEGIALVGGEALSFYGSIDFATGKVIEKKHPLFGKCIKDTILVFPGGKGSTVGSYGLYRLKKAGLAPKAMVNVETEPILATGAIISDIPLIDKLEADPLKVIKTGMRVRVDCVEGFIELE